MCYFVYFLNMVVIQQESKSSFSMHFIIKPVNYQTDFARFCDTIGKKVNYYHHWGNFLKYVLISAVSYDIFFNNLIINKLYYILPILFFIIH